MLNKPSMSLAVILVCALSSPVLAQNADAIRTRINSYKQLGASFKTVNDLLRRGDISIPALPQAAQRVANAAKQQYRWFPSSSRAAPGTRTAALPEIWSKAAEFKAAQDSFAKEAALLANLAGKGDAAAIRSQAKRVGGACKSCHDRFRAESD